MSTVYPTRSAVIIFAVILAVLLLPPQRANASDDGAVLAFVELGVVGLVAAADIGVGIYDIRASAHNQRISKPAAGIQLALMAPQLVLGTLALSSWNLSPGATVIGLALMAIPLSLAIYNIYVLVTPDPKAALTARLEKGFGIELPVPKVGGIERVMLGPTAISLTQTAGAARAFKTNQSTGSVQFAPGVALAFRF